MATAASTPATSPLIRANSPIRALRLTALASSVLALGLVGGISWVGTERALRRPHKAFGWQLADYPHLCPETASITGHGGTRLVGSFFAGRSRTTIVLSHGYGAHQGEMLPWADFLVRAGFSAFTYDMRARGGSGGDAITLGALEQHDLRAVVDYLVARPDVDPDRLGALGLSLGGAVTLLAAARDPRLKAIVDDCGFSDIGSAIGTAYRQFIGLPAFPFAPLSVLIGEFRTGLRLSQSRPMDIVGKIAPRPLLIIHGTDDREIPLIHSQRNYAAANAPRELWIIPGAAHAQSRAVAGPEYERRVTAFFRQHLGE
jgi:dipeptidyl aminopeptidase/acylaminoacyl peptidase